MHSSGCAALALLIGTSLSAIVAQEKGPQEKNPVATSPQAAGADFAYQGEYTGLLNGGFRPRRLGWQIVALGQGKFSVVCYEGGLPGSGWNRSPATTHEVELRGGFLQFDFEGLTAKVGYGRAWLRRPDGKLMGLLAKLDRRSPTLGAAPPRGAVVLFDGREPTLLQGAKLTADRLLEIGATTRQNVADFRLHFEFRTPFMPDARGQGRGNSGVYIQQRYEVQILDSFGLAGLDNECGGLYKQRAPSLNMCLPPLAWQTYDIEFRAARFDGGQKTDPARITVRHNGVLIHDDVELTNKTGGGKQEGAEALPILFQNHGNPVHFRNVWIVGL